MSQQVPTMEFLVFCLQAAPGVGASTLRAILVHLVREGVAPKEFYELNDENMSARFGLKQSAIDALRRPDDDTQETWQQLQARSVKILIYGQPTYPKRLRRLLGNTAPPVLYLLGDLDLLEVPAVGFCGSRNASEKGLRVADDCARLLARQQINIVSGYAQGVDIAAHRAALEAGGTTAIVLAEGILHFRVKQEIRPLMEAGELSRLVVVSEFAPTLSWRAHNAMTRNRTICGLSNAMIVIESGTEGGTFEAGKAALELGEPLFCVDYAEASPTAAGNPYFLSHGAFSLRRMRTGEPNLSRLISVVRQGGVSVDQLRQRDLLLQS
jgi:DNA processing protein